MKVFSVLLSGIVLFSHVALVIADSGQAAQSVFNGACVPPQEKPKTLSGAIGYTSLSRIDRQLLQRLNGVFHTFCEQPEAIWSASYRLDKIPLLLVYRDNNNQDRHGYLLNHPKAHSFPSAEAVVLETSMTSLPPVVKLNQLPQANALQKMQYADFQFEIADIPTFVVVYDSSRVDSFNTPTSASWDAFLIHEGLHHYQEGAWEVRDDERQNVRDYPLGREFIADILLETYILLDALSAQSAAQREQAIAYFVAVRTARMASHPIIAGMDGMQERYEGTAHYIEHRLKAIAPNNSLPNIEGLLRGNLLQQAPRVALALGRFYATGAALSMLLDDLAIEWKPLMESGATHYEILEQWLVDQGLNTFKRQQSIDEARRNYDYQTLLDQAEVTAERIASAKK